MFGPHSALRLAARDDYRAVALDPAELGDADRAEGSELARVLAAYRPDVLVVDLFWAPLRRLLPLPGCEAWLLLRRSPAVWLDGPPGYPFERRLFERVIAIEPGVHPGRLDETIDPIVVCNHEERQPAGALRRALGVDGSAQLAVAHQAGEAGEWATLTTRLSARPLHAFSLARSDSPATTPPEGVALHDGDAFFPLAAWLHDADVVASGAGYNAYWEARWLGYDARTTFFAFERTIDDQAWRLRTCGGYRPRDNGADLLARRLG